jgi:hypothetical protein
MTSIKVYHFLSFPSLISTWKGHFSKVRKVLKGILHQTLPYNVFEPRRKAAPNEPDITERTPSSWDALLNVNLTKLSLVVLAEFTLVHGTSAGFSLHLSLSVHYEQLCQTDGSLGPCEGHGRGESVKLHEVNSLPPWCCVMVSILSIPATLQVASWTKEDLQGRFHDVTGAATTGTSFDDITGHGATTRRTSGVASSPSESCSL